MSKRPLLMDDKTLSEMIRKNVAAASQMNVDMNLILNSEQMQLLTVYKATYNYKPYLSFFISLVIMSHCSQGSFYTHYANSDHRPVQLYLWLLGSSGSGKTNAFQQIEKAITKLEQMFPSAYLKPVMVNGKLTESDVSSIISHTNHLGLRQHLASNHKLLLNDDADLIGESYGLFNVLDNTKEHERNLILCGYDGFMNSSRSTGTTLIHIDDKRLSIALATTAGKLLKNMKNWASSNGFDGSHNRFIYMSLPKLAYSRPQDFQVQMNSHNNPSFAHLAVVVHLFGTVRYVFEMSEAERVKFYGASFNLVQGSQADDEQSQQFRSAMNTVWNLVADLIESHEQTPNQQQQITDFYGKAGTTFPRLACLMQLYMNAMAILDRVKDRILFIEGDNRDLTINQDFIHDVHTIIKNEYYTYDKTYLPFNEINQSEKEPMIVVHKEAVSAAWTWYEKHLDIIRKLFTIDYEFGNKPMGLLDSIPLKQKSLKQMIMSFDFNIFPLSAISVKHPTTGKTGIIKNRPAFGERALLELLDDNLIKFNYFLTDVRGRDTKAYFKSPIPHDDDPTRDEFLNNLRKHEIDINEYYLTYQSSSIPPTSKLSNLALEIFSNTASLVSEYSKYRVQLDPIIRKHMDDGALREVNQGHFVIENVNVFTCQFYQIKNLVLGSQSNGKRQSLHVSDETNTSIRQTRHTTVPMLDFLGDDGHRQNQEIQQHSRTRRSDDQTDISLPHTVDTSSEMELDQQADDSEDESNVSTRQPLANITNEYTNGIEEAVKRVMHAIMVGKSVIYGKTDFSKICNKQNIRLEAVKRLVDAKLLRYGDNYWVVPSRAKKEGKKECKRILRPGWLKNCPESDSNVSKFDFMQLLQKHANVSFDKFIKSFYPYEKENVFTNNGWTLSDELIDILQSNAFYRDHVRFNAEVFRPSDVMIGGLNSVNQRQTSSKPVSNSNSNEHVVLNDGCHGSSSQLEMNNHNIENEQIIRTCPRPTTNVNQNISLGTNSHNFQRRIQPRRTKKV